MKLLVVIKEFHPKIIIFLTVIVVVCVNFNITFWSSTKVIEEDVAFYYSYLPAVFYQHDISQNFLKDTANQFIESKYFGHTKLINGKYLFKGTMGMAVTYLPFFILADLYSRAANYPVTGYSESYHFAIQFSSLFYFIIGLLFLIKTLRFYFPKSVVFVTLFCITFGTNVLYYLTVGSGMSHAVNFGLISVFIYYTIKWHQKSLLKQAFVIGIIGGLLTLIRPINILIFIFFFLYNVKSVPEVFKRIKLFVKYKFQILLIILLGVLIFLPQLIYWKTQTGNWFFNSYVGEQFYFNNPHILEAVFGFRKGWLVYTPILIFSLIGFYFLFKSIKEFFYPVLILFLVYIYVAFSWWCWWYGGSYGQRALIDVYPFLAIPFAAFIFRAQELSVIKKRCFHGMLVILILLNLFQTMQAKWNTIHFDSMTREAYLDAFLRFTKNPEREKFLKHPDLQRAIKGIDEN